jgi:nucleotide-binding universal stress UspA family protein
MMSGQERRIVVGVDGSEPSKSALRWAIGQAKLTGGSVDAVIAWRHPSKLCHSSCAMPVSTRMRLRWCQQPVSSSS